VNEQSAKQGRAGKSNFGGKNKCINNPQKKELRLLPRKGTANRDGVDRDCKSANI
jgi:hypothetical protein